ncbi:MAG: hypothetical protein J6B62_01665 [Bacteroidales bacterium]|jgi:hypothetical protein|nr:hypothetical protein [Bacteroidales bacterium]
MEEKEMEYLDSYEASLLQEMLKLCTSLGKMDGTLLSSEDIDGKWKEFAPEYMMEAVKNINSYPEFTIGCAAYIGMAIAKWWDEDWGRHHNAGLGSLLGKRGFDDMDDHIVTDILGYGLDSKEAQMLSGLLLSCSQLAMDRIRHENIEMQTTRAFHILARTLRVMFRIGAALQLAQMNYKFEKVRYVTPNRTNPFLS